MKTKICVHLVSMVLMTCQSFGNIHGEPSHVMVGNTLPRGEDLRGETVYAIIGTDEAQVEALFDVTDFSPLSSSVLLPVFARVDDKPEDALRGARVRCSLGKVFAEQVAVADAPGGCPPVPAELQVVWFRITIAGLKAPRSAASAVVLRVSYTQPLIDRKFYYLPQSTPIGVSKDSARRWAYPLIARAPDRRLLVSAGDSVCEKLGDAAVVYLKCDQIVEMEVR